MFAVCIVQDTDDHATRILPLRQGFDTLEAARAWAIEDATDAGLSLAAYRIVGPA
jgi:hypothetical protein